MRKALIVGIDHYNKGNCLHGCVNDANAIMEVLERNSDGSINFSINKMLARDPSSGISKKELKNNVTELFKYDVEIALLYFSGHGYIENNTGYLITSDVEYGDDGLSMDEILKIVNGSSAKNKIVILDCCHAGAIGTSSLVKDNSILSEGSTFLTASESNQYSMENGGHGVFTTLLVDALCGGAANLVGDITPGSVYAHIDQALGPWQQRPIFKTNVKSFISLRKVTPPVELNELRQIVKLFHDKDFVFPLDPSYEPERCGHEGENVPQPILENNKKFATLQIYNRINLVVPVDAPHMWHAAMNSKACKLTALGKHYWQLVKDKRL